MLFDGGDNHKRDHQSVLGSQTLDSDQLLSAIHRVTKEVMEQIREFARRISESLQADGLSTGAIEFSRRDSS
jgi:hypothetical protein